MVKVNRAVLNLSVTVCLYISMENKHNLVSNNDITLKSLLKYLMEEEMRDKQHPKQAGIRSNSCNSECLTLHPLPFRKLKAEITEVNTTSSKLELRLLIKRLFQCTKITPSFHCSSGIICQTVTLVCNVMVTENTKC